MLQLQPPSDAALQVSQIFLAPADTSLSLSARTKQLTLGGSLHDGRVVNLTTAAGVVYTASDEGVVRVSASGLVSAVAGGTTVVIARYAGLSTTARVTVAAPAAVASIAEPRSRT